MQHDEDDSAPIAMLEIVGLDGYIGIGGWRYCRGDGRVGGDDGAGQRLETIAKAELLDWIQGAKTVRSN